VKQNIKVLLAGVRGSIPVSGKQFERYGGCTGCVLVQMGGENILLDGGTGLTQAAYRLSEENKCTILLSHPHIDHLLGIPLCPIFFDSQKELTIRAKFRNGLSTKEQVAALFSPPLWPVSFEVFRSKVIWEDITKPSFDVGSVMVETMEGNHPGGVTLYRLYYNGVSLVYVTDCELDETTFSEICYFARDCDLLLCDAHYTTEEYASRKGWGHSSWDMVVALGEACQAKRTVLIHHAPEYTDALLDKGQLFLEKYHPSCTMGRCNEELFL